jgi:hypothetical protein
MKRIFHFLFLVLPLTALSQDKFLSQLEAAYLVRDTPKADSILNSSIQEWKSMTMTLSKPSMQEEDKKQKALSELVELLYKDIIIPQVPGDLKYIILPDSIPVIIPPFTYHSIPINTIEIKHPATALYLTREMDSVLYSFTEKHTILEAGKVKDETNSSFRFLQDHNLPVYRDTDIEFRDAEREKLLLMKRRPYKKVEWVFTTTPFLSHLSMMDSGGKHYYAHIATPSETILYDCVYSRNKWKISPAKVK